MAKMKNCLFSKTETDLLGALRRGEDLVPLIKRMYRQKAAEKRGGQMGKTLIISIRIVYRIAP